MNVSNTVSVDVSATLPVDQLLDQRLERLAVLVERGNGLLPAALAWAHVGLLVGDEVGRRQEPVLEVVDAELRGLGVGHRAEVAGDLQAALVRLVDRRAQLLAA